MAVGNFTVFNIAKEKIAKATIDLDSHSFKAVLTTSAQSIAATFAGTSTDCRLADLTNEVSGTGYTTGGTAVTLSVTRSTGTVTVDSTDPQWTTATITAKYLIIYDDTDANNSLLGFYDLDTGGGSVSSTAGTFQVTVNASGLFTLA